MKIHIRMLSEYMITNGYNIHVCAINTKKSDDLENVGREHFHVLNREWKGGLIPTVQNYLMFKRILKELKPKYIIANCELPELYIAIGAPKGSSIIAVEHTSNPWAGRKLLGKAVRGILKFRRAHWVTVSNSAAAIWKGAKFPQYIANPIDIGNITHIESNERQDLIFVGRLRIEKHPEWVIEAGIRLGLEVHIFGDGENRPELERIYTNSNPNIHFQGFMKNPWSEIFHDSLIVVPSDFEGDGMVVAEALMLGRQVLLRDNKDLRRFRLPDNNYFANKEELISKIDEWNQSGRKSLLVPKEILDELKEVRNIKSIASTWCNVLKIDELNQNGVK
jgi:glycosyltransferase involved in cell wall biosynthesis